MGNMKKVTRITALVLAFALCFCACGSKGNADVEKEIQVSTQVGTESKNSEVAQKAYWEMLEEVTDTSQLPDWTGDTLDVTIWYAASSSGCMDEVPDTAVTLKEFERVTGVRFNWEESFDNGGNNVDAKLPMVIASGDLPTMVVGYDIESTMLELWEEGYLADLTQYMEDGTLDQVQKWLPTDECSIAYNDKKDANGSYYLFPMVDTDRVIEIYSATGYCPDEIDLDYYYTYGTSPMSVGGGGTGTGIAIREDILQALRPDTYTLAELEEIYVNEGSYTEEQIYDVGLESAEDFYALLREIKELIASGEYVGVDGNPVEVTYGPHTETDNWYWMVFLPMYLYGMDTNADYFASFNANATDTEHMIQRAIDSELYTNYMKELNALVQEDVIAKNSLLENNASFSEKIDNDHYVVKYVSGDGTAAAQAEEGYVYRPIWINTDKYTDFTGFGAFKTNTYFGIFKDTLSDDEMEQLMHAMNYLNSEVGINNFYWGPESAGLFTTDENGVRSYVDEELYNNMILMEDNGANVKYGLVNRGVGTQSFISCLPKPIMTSLYTPRYLSLGSSERSELDAKNYYNPGTLEGQSYAENVTRVKVNCNVYGNDGQQIEGLKDFWSVRNAFEDQVKKTIAAESDTAYEEQYQKLVELCEENGLNEETLAEWSTAWAALNEEELKLAGLWK